MIGPSISSTVKLLCSYGGTILPSFQDHDKLRYYGGHTRVLSIDRSIPFGELMVKLEELCGALVSSIRCQLPSKDLDALVSLTCNDDVSNLIEEYDKAAAGTSSSSSPKIRMFLFKPKSIKKVSPPHPLSSPSHSPSYNFSYNSSFFNAHSPRRIPSSNYSFCHDKYSGKNSTGYQRQKPCRAYGAIYNDDSGAQVCSGLPLSGREDKRTGRH